MTRRILATLLLWPLALAIAWCLVSLTTAARLIDLQRRVARWGGIRLPRGDR